METPFCGSKIWLVFLITNITCFLFLCFDYSSKFRTKLDDFAPNPNNRTEPVLSDSCSGRYVYIHNLPSRFNQALLDDCEAITRKSDRFDMCLFVNNSGFGPKVNTTSSWYFTNQFMLEVIFHNRMKRYECLTNDSSLASAIFVPFYAGLELRRHLWGYNTSVRDSLGFELVDWLVGRPEWNRMSGLDHFLVSGRISRDFRRESDRNREWGSKFRVLSLSKNVSMLSIESGSWDNDFAIPYPTSFHPSTNAEVLEWQNSVRRKNRPYLFSFVGARRSRQKGSIRDKIIDQCIVSVKYCKFLDCSLELNDCDNPITTIEVLQKSVYCLQPRGDSFTRRSTFDSILTGCIPVFFDPKSAYTQYLWHLAENYTNYSIYIPTKNFRNKNFKIENILRVISEEAQEAMREEVIRLIPRIVYAERGLSQFEDAFDIALKGILSKIEKF